MVREELPCRGFYLQAFAAGCSFLTNAGRQGTRRRKLAQAGAGGRISPAAGQLRPPQLVLEILLQAASGGTSRPSARWRKSQGPIASRRRLPWRRPAGRRWRGRRPRRGLPRRCGRRRRRRGRSSRATGDSARMSLSVRLGLVRQRELAVPAGETAEDAVAGIVKEAAPRRAPRGRRRSRSRAVETTSRSILASAESPRSTIFPSSPAVRRSPVGLETTSATGWSRGRGKGVPGRSRL